MDAQGVNTGARAALSALKESYAIGKESAELIGQIQADNSGIVRAEQKKRVQERQ